MNLYEIFKECNSDDIIEEMCKDKSFLEEIDWDNRINNKQKELLKNRVKAMYKKEIKNIQDGYYVLEKTTNNPVLVIIKQMFGPERYELGMFYEKNYEDALNYDMLNIEDFKNPLVSTTFQERATTLSLMVSPYILSIYKKETIAAAALREMCFFGIDNEIREEAITNVINDLKQSEKELETGNILDKCYTFEEIEKELGFEDNRTEEEKELERENIRKESIQYITHCMEIMKETAKIMMEGNNNE